MWSCSQATQPAYFGVCVSGSRRGRNVVGLSALSVVLVDTSDRSCKHIPHSSARRALRRRFQWDTVDFKLDVPIAELVGCACRAYAVRRSIERVEGEIKLLGNWLDDLGDVLLDARYAFSECDTMVAMWGRSAKGISRSHGHRSSDGARREGVPSLTRSL